MSELNKPAGLSDSDYYVLRMIHQDRCVYCGEQSADLEWDHVMPQSLGGWNSVWNLEPSCRACNARKSNLLTPNSYWFKTTFVFDARQGVDLDKFRKSQLLPYTTLLEYKDYFKDEVFLKQLFRFQLLYLATVSAGKTLSILSILFALNKIFLDIYLASPRIDKALVITKDEDLRDQLVSELKKEPLKYGIFTNDVGLKVEAVETRSRALQIVKKNIKDRNLTKNTIYVCCQQLLWEDKREEEVNEIIKSFLSIFRAAFFDESHWSPKQARKIQRYLPFFKLNLTGTPFDKNGTAYDHQIKIAHWGSQQARQTDGSLKMLPISPEGVIIQPKPAESEFELAGNLSIKENKIDDHKNNIKTVITCIRSGLLRLRADDQICKQVARDKELLAEGALSISEFRDKYLHPERIKYEIDSDSIPDLIYPSFMGVVVSDFNELQSIKEQFKALVLEFPEFLSHKDIISVAYGPNNEDDDQKGGKKSIPSISLGEEHPWMLTHNQISLPFEYSYDGKRNFFEWKLPKQTSRILLYFNKNREGCNNRYARIFVLARTLTSKKTLVQSIGRYIRGVRYVALDDSVHVPPKQLDQPLIISHDAFQNESALLWTWQYLQDSGNLSEEFPTLESLVAGLEPTSEQEQDNNEPIIITNTSKMDIAEAVGRLQVFEATGDLTHLTTSNGELDPRFKQGTDNAWEVDTTHWVELDNDEKLEQVQELVGKVRESPEETAKALFGAEIASEAIREVSELKVLPVLKHESFDFYNAALEIIEDTIKSLDPISYQMFQYIPDSQVANDLLRKKYAEIMDRNHIRQEPSKHLNVEQIRSSIESSIKEDFGFLRIRLGSNSPEWREFCGDIIRTTRRTVYELFGLTSFEVGSEFDTPEYHWKLIKNKSKVRKQVRRILIHTNQHLTYLRNVVPD